MSQLAEPLPRFTTHLPITRSAVVYAHDLYEGLGGDDDPPLIDHALDVGRLLYQTGAPDYVVAAGILHDVVEDTGVEIDELRGQFGSRVATLVAALTEDGSIELFRARKEALRRQIRRAGSDAGAICAADKLSRLRQGQAGPGLWLDDNRPPADSGHRLEHFVHSLRLLQRMIPEHPLVARLRYELRAVGAVA